MALALALALAMALAAINGARKTMTETKNDPAVGCPTRTIGYAVLIGCEESQTICAAMREAGIEAYSCDLQPTRGNPEWHYQADIMRVIPMRRWDLIILHPDCTAMAVSGNRWYGRGMPMHHKREAAIEWTLKLWELAKLHSERVALENPVSVIFTHLPNVFYLQPHDHGHGETKKTGFALHNLEPLELTNKVAGREQRIWKMPPSATRKRDRSQTFPGVAEAIVQQWGLGHNAEIRGGVASPSGRWRMDSLEDQGRENEQKDACL